MPLSDEGKRQHYKERHGWSNIRDSGDGLTALLPGMFLFVPMAIPDWCGSYADIGRLETILENQGAASDYLDKAA